MVSYTRFSRDATSADRKKLWNPPEILGIINTDPGYQCITCVGHAPSQGRRCRIALRKDNKYLITETLDEIAYLSPGSPAIIPRLRAIVGPALCVRYHQGQAESVLMQWQRKIMQVKPQIGERKPAKPVTSSKKQEPSRDQTVEDLQEQLREMRELLAKMREEVNSQRYQDQGSERPEEQAVKDREEVRKHWRSKEKEKEARRQEKERLEKERLEKERLEKERLEKERLEKERLEKERLEKERLEKERLEKEQKEREEKIRRERIRQNAQKLREEREREKREREKKERKEWDQLWTKYQEQWVDFRASTTREGNIRNAIPWPVKSGLTCEVKASKVKEFFQNATPRGANMAKLMRKECQKWHPDTYQSWLRGSRLADGDKMMVDMICRVVTGLLDESAGRSAEFLG